LNPKKEEEISMKTKLIQLLMVSFVVFGLLTFFSITLDFPGQLTRSFGVNAVYAKGGWWPKPCPEPRPASPVPEPSTLILLSAGLAAGGSYLIVRRRNRNKRK